MASEGSTQPYQSLHITTVPIREDSRLIDLGWRVEHSSTSMSQYVDASRPFAWMLIDTQ